MEVEYLLCAKGKEMRVSGQYIPRPKDIIQIMETGEADGMYQVYEVVNWIRKKGEYRGNDVLEAELPRVMLVSLGDKLE